MATRMDQILDELIDIANSTPTDTREIDLEATYDVINSQNKGKGIGHTLDGVHGYFRVERSEHSYGLSTTLMHDPSAKGKRSEAYSKVRSTLGDDYSSYFDEEWPEAFFKIVTKRGLWRYKS